METVQIEIGRKFGLGINRVAAPPLRQTPAQSAETEKINAAQLHANITIALLGNEHRTLWIAIAVVIAMMAAILAM